MIIISEVSKFQALSTYLYPHNPGLGMTHHLTANEIEQIYGPIIEFVESIPGRVTWAKKCTNVEELQAHAQQIGGLLNAPLPKLKIKALRSVGQQLACLNPQLGQSDSVCATIVTEIWKPSLVTWMEDLADIVSEPGNSPPHLRKMRETWACEDGYGEVLNYLLDERAFLLATLLKCPNLDCDSLDELLNVPNTQPNHCESNPVQIIDATYPRLWDYAQKTWAPGIDKYKICKHITDGPGNYSACVEDLIPNVGRAAQTKRFHSVLGGLNKEIQDVLALEVYRRGEQILVCEVGRKPLEHKRKSKKTNIKKPSTKKFPTKRNR